MFVYALVSLVICISLFASISYLSNGDKPYKSSRALNNTNETLVCAYGYNGDQCDECGVTFTGNNLLIAGGISANSYSWPSMAFVYIKYKADVYFNSKNITKQIIFSYSCGGTLIDRKTVLTAGHCIITQVNYMDGDIEYTLMVSPNNYHPTVESIYAVYLGMQNKSTASHPPTKKKLVSKVIRHENFDEEQVLNDIAILVLDSDVELNEYIQVACLPKPFARDFPHVNTSSYAVGWGRISNFGSTSDSLRNVELSIYDKSACEEFELYGLVDWNIQFCAGDLSGVKDTCAGDSGGPVFVKERINDKEKYVIAGIVSYGSVRGCAVPGTAGVYTRVSSYVKWINKNINPRYNLTADLDNHNNQANSFKIKYSLLISLLLIFIFKFCFILS